MYPTLMMVTYNRLHLTKKTFDTSFINTGCKYNLVIVDNNSSDETVDWLKNNIDKYSNINKYYIVKLNKNMGIAYGRSLCLKKYSELYKSKYLCTIDNDVTLPNNWLDRCCKILDNNKLILSCGVNLEGASYPKTKIKIGNDYEEIQIKQKGNLGTACAVFNSNIFTKIGYFNNFDKYGHEDALYFYRMRMTNEKGILAYIKENGDHLGVGIEDSGAYREMKNKYWDINMKLFQRDIRLFANKIKPLYVEFDNYDPSIEELCLSE